MESTVDHSADLITSIKYTGVIKENGWYLTALRKSLKLNDSEWALFLRKRAEDNMARRSGFSIGSRAPSSHTVSQSTP